MSRTIRFATIGSGSVARNFVKGAHHDPRFELVAIYSRTQERAQAFAAEVGVPGARLFTSLEALAQDPQVDAVYIASPNSCHAPQALLMMAHGKHVLCEKPFAVSAQEGARMIRVARESRTPAGAPVVLMEALMSTLLPNYEQVRKALPRIGPVRRYFAPYCQYSSRYDDFKKGVVANVFQKEMGGGSLVDLGVYGVAPLVHLFGMPPHWDTDRRVVQASDWKLSGGVDGMGTVLLQYPGMQAVVIHSKIGDSTLCAEILGDEGRITLDRISTMWHPQLFLRTGEVEDLSVPTCPDRLYYELREFIDVIERGESQSKVNSWERTLQVLQLMDLARQRASAQEE